MSTIKSSNEHLTLNADGSGNDIKFQSNGSEVASISDGGVITATTFTGSATDSTKVPLAGGTMTGTLGVTTVDFGDWTITESSGVLYFATGGTNKMKLDASGNLTCVGDVTANGSM